MVVPVRPRAARERHGRRNAGDERRGARRPGGGLRASAIEPGLEDVFIHLMRRAPEPVTVTGRAEG